jgi:hypothetical protein
MPKPKLLAGLRNLNLTALAAQFNATLPKALQDVSPPAVFHRCLPAMCSFAGFAPAHGPLPRRGRRAQRPRGSASTPDTAPTPPFPRAPP